MNAEERRDVQAHPDMRVDARQSTKIRDV